MRILQFGKFFPPDIGGIETVIEDLTLALNKKKGIVCDVLCSNSKNAYQEDILPCGGRVMRCASLGKVASTSICPQMIFKLREIIADYDIIHMHLPDPMANVALLLSKHKDKKIILHWHSDIIKQKNLLKIYMPMQTRLLKIADFIIGTSQKYIDESSFLKPFRDKCVGIPIGVDKEALQSVEVEKDSIIAFPKDKKVIFALGRLAPNKGFRYLIESAKYLSDDYVVYIGGDGKLRDSLNALIMQQNLQDKVFLIGKVDRRNVQYYYTNCHIFVLPSIQESYGIVLIEAMSFRKPVICTKLYPSGNDWINQDNKTGLTIDSMDSKGIAEAIKKIESNYEFYANNAYERYLSEFSQDKMIDSIVNLYHHLLHQ